MHDIELLDETLREGRSRGFYSCSVEDQLELVREIHAITGIERFCVGFGISDADFDLLLRCLDASERGALPPLRWRILATYQTADAVLRKLDALSAAQRGRVILGLSCRASEILARLQDSEVPASPMSEATPWPVLVGSLQRAYSSLFERARSRGFAEVHA